MTSASPSGHVIRHTTSGRQGSRTLISTGENRLSRAARQPGIRLPSVTQFTSVDRPGIEPGSPDCQPGVFPLDHQPVAFSGPPGNRTPIAWVQTKRLPVGPAARIFKRFVPELNQVLLLTTEVCCQNTYRPFCNSDPGRTRTVVCLAVAQASLPLDQGISSDRGGRRTHKITHDRVRSGGVTGSRARISSMPCWCLPVGP